MKLDSGLRARRRGSSEEVRPVLIELTGPAGAGKTTLRRELLTRDPTIEFIGLLGRGEVARSYVREAMPLVPAYLTNYRGTRWFTRSEGKAIGLLRSWQRAVDEAEREGRILLMDQGPVFRLAVLSEFGPPVAQSRAFDRALQRWSRAWGHRLDLVVQLSAAPDVLLHRIRTRPQDHTVKQWADEPALQRVHRYEAAIDRTIERLRSTQDLTVVRVDTSTQSASSLADTVLAAAEGRRVHRG
jgi:hypothetical protein